MNISFKQQKQNIYKYHVVIYLIKWRWLISVLLNDDVDGHNMYEIISLLQSMTRLILRE